MFGSRIKIDKALYDRAAAMAAKAGYSSVDEFVTSMIEKELAKLEDDSDQKGLEDRLRGLGYIE